MNSKVLFGGLIVVGLLGGGGIASLFCLHSLPKVADMTVSQGGLVYDTPNRNRAEVSLLVKEIDRLRAQLAERNAERKCDGIR